MCLSLPGVLTPQGPPVAGSQGAQVLLLSPQIRAQNEGGGGLGPCGGLQNRLGSSACPSQLLDELQSRNGDPGLGEPKERTVGSL